MVAAIKMDELLVSWLGRDDVYESVLEWIDSYSVSEAQKNAHSVVDGIQKQVKELSIHDGEYEEDEEENKTGETESETTDDDRTTAGSACIPPFYPLGQQYPRRRLIPRSIGDSRNINGGSLKNSAGGTSVRNSMPGLLTQHDTWEPLRTENDLVNDNATHANVNFQSEGSVETAVSDFARSQVSSTLGSKEEDIEDKHDQDQKQKSTQFTCARDCAKAIFDDISDPTDAKDESEGVKYLTVDQFSRVTKEVCRFPSYFNVPLYTRIIELWNSSNQQVKEENTSVDAITLEMLGWFFKTEMEPFDAYDRFFRLVRQPQNKDYIVRDDFLPFIKALLSDHPGLEFLSSHAEFQEKYAITVITRIFYSVNRCHSGRITSRQVRRSDLLNAFVQVDEEEDINKVTRYFSYEHFYVLYCRFWELDHDRDYKITREDLLKYGDHSLSHMIVDRIFDAAPRPFDQAKTQDQQQNSSTTTALTSTDSNNAGTSNSRNYLSYEDFIYFMLSEEDKSNEVAVRYWFACVDVDGDNKLNNMEMRSFYAVQLHRMQCMGHEIVPFDDMLCQMMDMIKPANTSYLVVEDFLQVECSQVSGSLFDALFNLNKYLMFEQRDPFAERQKREDEFECDWDRFACIDYNRLAMEEEAREEEAMEIDWVTVDDEDDEDNNNSSAQEQQSDNMDSETYSHRQQQL